MKRVVITGLGALTPIGNNIEEFWKNLLAGKSGADYITKFDYTNFKTHFACELKDFKAEEHFDRKEMRKMDLVSQYALVATQEAITDAKIDFTQLNTKRIGVIWGSGNGGVSSFENEVTEFAKGNGTPRFNPFFVPKTLVDTTSGLISIKHGLKGINFTTISACASANTALIDAFNYIRWGKVDMMISGGSEAPICPSLIGGFNALKALSTHNENPQIASRPFDKNRDGFVMGEGAGAFILEEYEHAKKRGAKIYAEFVGGGMSADAYHMTATHPEGEGAIWGMEQALEDANLKYSDIDHLNMHATSTPVGDLSELKAIKGFFKEHLPNVSISATKSMTGHLLGAASAIEGIISVLSIKNNQIPAIANVKELDENVSDEIQLVLNKSIDKKVNVAMSNSFGFGGHNATVIFKKI